MAALPYIQLYVADYLADTAHLNAAQHGAYLLLLFNYWQRGKPLNNSNERLSNVARMSNEEWEQNKPAISEFFKIDGDEWSHDRVNSDLAAVLSKSTKAAESGRASAAKRTANVQRPLNDRSTTVKRPFNHKDTDTDTDTDTDNKKNISGYPQEFEQAWGAYPKKPGASKKESFRCWSARIKSGVDADVILNGVNRYAIFCDMSGTQPSFIKQPATFFGPNEHYLSDWNYVESKTKPPTAWQDKKQASDDATSRALYGDRNNQLTGNVIEGDLL
jgi:uncharacterized protein YdaU (DUF1376 family)